MIDLENKIKKESKKTIISRLDIQQKPIDFSSYKSDGKIVYKRFNAFSTLGLLNQNSDIFHHTKNSLSTILKTIYTPEEIKDLIEKTNSSSFNNFVQKIEKAIKNPTKGMYINSIAKNISKILTDLKAGKEIKFVDKNANEFISSQFQQFSNGPAAFVSGVSKMYGDNRYFNKINARIGVMTPLFAKFDNDKEADEKIFEIENYIKDTYKYRFKLDTKISTNYLTRTLNILNYENKMDNCINMFYSVAKNLKGSKNIDLNIARNLLSKEEHNDFLTKKNIFGNYLGVKYTVVDKEQKVDKIFKAHSETISDVIATLTTIFMARLAFDYKYFAEIERDLTEQAANKMKYLAFSKNPDEDYWINQLIAEGLKKNIAQVCASNDITDAKQLIELYNLNGTKIVNPEKITSIDDLIFSLQYSINQKVKNDELINLPEKKIEAKKTLKNKEIKFKAPNFKPKANAYLDELRKSESYKKYLKQYQEEYKNLTLNKNDLYAKAELDEIKDSTNKNLQILEDIAKREFLEKDTKEDILQALAQNDAVKNVAEKLSDTQEEIVNDKNSDEKTEYEKTEDKNNEDASPEDEKSDDKKSDDKNAEDEKVDKKAEDDKIEDKKVEDEKTEYENVEDDAKAEENDTKKPVLIFKTEKSLKNLNEEELKKRIKKYFSKIIFGSNSKAGIVSEKLSYRIINKKTSKNASVNDSERLDDSQFKKANKIRDNKIDLLINGLTNEVFNFYNEDKDNLSDATIPQLCNKCLKSNLRISDDKTFTLKDVKKLLAFTITELVNPELKPINIELYMGKKSYKKMGNLFSELEKGEE